MTVTTGAERGSSFVELALAMGLAGVVLAGVALVTGAVERVERQTARVTSAQREVAEALARITSLVRQAGSCLPAGVQPLSVSAGGAALTISRPRWAGPGSLACDAGNPVEAVTFRVYGGRLLEDRAGSPSYLTSEHVEVAGLTVVSPPGAGSAALVQVCLEVPGAQPSAGGGSQPWRACSAALSRGGW